jgi:hypothetical protein
MTLVIMTLNRTALSIAMLIIVPYSIIKLNRGSLIMTYSLEDTQSDYTRNNVTLSFTLNFVRLSVVMLGVVMLRVLLYSVSLC